MNQSNTETEIIGYDGKYTIDKEGNVYSYAQTKKRKLKPQRASQSKKGYFQVRLHSKEVNVINSKGNQYGKLQYLHRLVWETYNGEIPEGMEIDHIDADTTNNKLSNLRVITQRQNAIKSKPIRELPTGVCYYRGRTKPYMATIQLYNKQKFLGYFETPEEAGEAYQEALSNIGRPSGNF